MISDNKKWHYLALKNKRIFDCEKWHNRSVITLYRLLKRKDIKLSWRFLLFKLFELFMQYGKLI